MHQPPGSGGAGDGAQTSRDYPILCEMGRVRDAACRGEQEHVMAGARLAGLEAEVRAGFVAGFGCCWAQERQGQWGCLEEGGF